MMGSLNNPLVLIENRSTHDHSVYCTAVTRCLTPLCACACGVIMCGVVRTSKEAHAQ